MSSPTSLPPKKLCVAVDTSSTTILQTTNKAGTAGRRSMRVQGVPPVLNIKRKVQTRLHNSGDLVFAKVKKGFTAWPAKVMSRSRGGKYQVIFYGTYEVGKNLKQEDIYKYENYREQFRGPKRPTILQNPPQATFRPTKT